MYRNQGTAHSRLYDFESQSALEVVHALSGDVQGDSTNVKRITSCTNFKRLSASKLYEL